MGKEKQICLIKKREILTDKIKSRKDEAVYSFLPLCFILYRDFVKLVGPWVWNLTTSVTKIRPSCHKKNRIVFLELIRKHKPKTPSHPVLIWTQPETKNLGFRKLLWGLKAESLIQSLATSKHTKCVTYYSDQCGYCHCYH